MSNITSYIPCSGLSESNIHAEMSTLRRQLLRYCEFLCGSHHDAEDVVQATLIKALPVLQGAKEHPNVSALLRRIAKNTWLDVMRRQEKCQPCGPEELDAMSGVVPQEERSSLEEALQTLVEKLTSQQRAIVLLSEVYQYSDCEAAKLLGISTGAVKATLHRARVRLANLSEDAEILSITDETQREILKAYVSAFQAGDIPTLIHLCQCGVLDSVQAISSVVAFSERKTAPKSTRYSSHTSMLAAA